MLKYFQSNQETKNHLEQSKKNQKIKKSKSKHSNGLQSYHLQNPSSDYLIKFTLYFKLFVVAAMDYNLVDGKLLSEYQYRK